jgi:hypothetical protein
MPAPRPSFRESNLFAAPIRDLRLAIDETPLAPVIVEFQAELVAKGITRLVPKFHLSTEWGVPFGTVVIGIPFYLARPELTELHGEEVGHVEGLSRADILRYLRHEMGHVVNYAYKLYDGEEWVKLFGSITQPYLEDYRPQPFSKRFVRHLPGWYAQKHPDEDWAETFAVWMTPGRDWRQEYAQRAAALAKLEYCDRTMQRLNQHDPPVVAAELDEDVGELAYSLRDYYKNLPAESEPSAGLDGDLRAIFDDLPLGEGGQSAGDTAPAGALVRRLERELMADVFRWTGHFPERTRSLMRHLAKRADALGQVYPRQAETEAIIGVTILVTSLAMNFVHRGSYFPEAQPPTAAAALAAEKATELANEPPAPMAKTSESNGSEASTAASSPPKQAAS